MFDKLKTIRSLLKDPRRLDAFAERVARIVVASFDGDVIARPRITQAEVRERTNMCYDLFIALRTDQHYSTHKALDVLPAALRSRLDGTEWRPTPPERSWGAGGTV